jgi:hypothetical protein
MREKIRLVEFVLTDSGAKTAAAARHIIGDGAGVGIGLGDRTGGTGGGEGVITDVLILGSKSRNGRTYSAQAMKEAVGMYGAVAVYVDHDATHKGGRRAGDRFGRLVNIRYVESAKGPQLRGDLHYLTTHPMASRIREDLERNLGCFGFSHVVDAQGEQQADGTWIISRITRVLECDIVTNAATVSSLREQTQTQNAGRVALSIPTEPKALAAWLKSTH